MLCGSGLSLLHFLRVQPHTNPPNHSPASGDGFFLAKRLCVVKESYFTTQSWIRFMVAMVYKQSNLEDAS